jgi:hypothetical protein
MCHVLIVNPHVFSSFLSQHSLLSSDFVSLQFLVSKLVACCIPFEANGEHSGTRSSQVLSLLLQLTMDSDPSLYDYIRVGFSESLEIDLFQIKA